MKIVLPLPPKELSPNARVHWAQTRINTRLTGLRGTKMRVDKQVSPRCANSRGRGRNLIGGSDMRSLDTPTSDFPPRLACAPDCFCLFCLTPPPRRMWTQEEVDSLVALYKKHEDGPVPLAEFAAAMGRLKSNVSRKARELGLTRSGRRDPNKHWPDGAYKSCRKYETREEMRQAVNEKQKRWYSENPHPRGALGMKHTPEVCAQIRARVERWWKNATPEQKDAAARKATMTKLKRYGTGNPSMLGENAFSRCKGGKREDLDNRYFRSAWEANYARYLNFLVANGQIRGWEYEPKTFVFHGVTRGALTYTPDFLVTENDGSQAWHEVKGWMTSQSKTRMKRMAKYYPDEKIVLIDEGQYREVKKYSGMIPGWE